VLLGLRETDKNETSNERKSTCLFIYLEDKLINTEIFEGNMLFFRLIQSEFMKIKALISSILSLLPSFLLNTFFLFFFPPLFVFLGLLLFSLLLLLFFSLIIKILFGLFWLFLWRGRFLLIKGHPQVVQYPRDELPGWHWFTVDHFLKLCFRETNSTTKVRIVWYMCLSFH